MPRDYYEVHSFLPRDLADLPETDYGNSNLIELVDDRDPYVAAFMNSVELELRKIYANQTESGDHSTNQGPEPGSVDWQEMRLEIAEKLLDRLATDPSLLSLLEIKMAAEEVIAAWIAELEASSGKADVVAEAERLLVSPDETRARLIGGRALVPSVDVDPRLLPA